MTKSLDPRALVARLADAFQWHSSQSTQDSVAAQHARFSVGTLASSAVGRLPDIPAYTIKVEARLPGKNPSISGFVHLYDRDTGRLLALMESSYISSVGSALTGALATDLLASPEATSLALVGNGTQGWLGLRFLMEMRGLEEIFLFDLNRRKSVQIAERLKKYKNLTVRVCDSLGGAVSGADIISCATWSRRPLLYSEMIKPGAHVSTLGADEVGKKELSSEFLRSGSFFCDDRRLAVSVGPLHGLSDGDGLVVAELGEVLAGLAPGRRSTEEITVYGAVGLPFVDLIATWAAYRKAAKKNLGTDFQMF